MSEAIPCMWMAGGTLKGALISARVGLSALQRRLARGDVVKRARKLMNGDFCPSDA